MTTLKLPFLRRHIPQPRTMRGDVVHRVFQMHALVRWRVLGDAHARPPFLRGPDRALLETAAAIRADVVQLVLGAIRTERALIGTDPRIERTPRQVLVAIFAVRPKLQRHDLFPLASYHRKSGREVERRISLDLGRTNF